MLGSQWLEDTLQGLYWGPSLAAHEWHNPFPLTHILSYSACRTCAGGSTAMQRIIFRNKPVNRKIYLNMAAFLER